MTYTIFSIAVVLGAVGFVVYDAYKAERGVGK